MAGTKKGVFPWKGVYFSSLDFIARLTLHIPPKGKHLVRRYGVCSSRSRGTWKHRPALFMRAAEGWYVLLLVSLGVNLENCMRNSPNLLVTRE